MSTPRDLTEANSPAVSSKLVYPTAGADLGGGDPATGFQALGATPDDTAFPADSNGDTYAGNPYNPPHGFLTRPQGWER